MKRRSSLSISVVIVFFLSCICMSPSFSEETRPEELTLTLGECIQLALESNLDIAAQKIDPEISKLNYEIAKTLFDPVLSANVSRSVQNSQAVSFISVTQRESDNYGVSVGGNVVTGGQYSVSLDASRSFLTAGFPITFNPSYSSGLNFSFSQPFLKNFGREVTKYNIYVSKNNYDMSNSRFRQIVIETVNSAEQAYWNLVGARDYLNVQKESLKLAEDQLERNRIMVRVGTKAPIDVTEAEATVASRKVSVIDAENLIKTAEDSLRRVLSITPESPLWHASIIPKDRPSFEAVDVDLEESIKTALMKRPELEESEISLKTLELNMRYQRNQQLPDLSVNGTYGVSGVSGEVLPGPDGILGTGDDIYIQEGIGGAFDDIKDRNYTNWSLGVNFSIPIRNRAAARQYVISKLNYDKTSLQHRSLQQTIAIEVKEAARNIETNQKRLEAVKAARILSKERLNATQKRFENGMATNFEVSEYQQLLASAETEEIRAIIQYSIALLSLEKAKGNLLQSRGIVLESME